MRFTLRAYPGLASLEAGLVASSRPLARARVVVAASRRAARPRRGDPGRVRRARDRRRARRRRSAPLALLGRRHRLRTARSCSRPTRSRWSRARDDVAARRAHRRPVRARGERDRRRAERAFRARRPAFVAPRPDAWFALVEKRPDLRTRADRRGARRHDVGARACRRRRADLAALGDRDPDAAARASDQPAPRGAGPRV